MPGVRHCAPCCDQPHVDQIYDIGFFSLPQDVQDEVNAHAAAKHAEEKKDG